MKTHAWQVGPRPGLISALMFILPKGDRVGSLIPGQGGKTKPSLNNGQGHVVMHGIEIRGKVRAEETTLSSTLDFLLLYAYIREMISAERSQH